MTTITHSPALTTEGPLFDQCLAAAQEVGRAYRLTVDLQLTLTPETKQALVRTLLERYDETLARQLWRLPRTEHRMVVMYLLGHASLVHDDIEVRREVLTWLLPADDEARLWTDREPCGVWVRAALSEAMTVREFYLAVSKEYDGGLWVDEEVADEVAGSVLVRLVPYRRFLTEGEWCDVFAVAVSGAEDAVADVVVSDLVEDRLLALWTLVHAA